MSSDSPFSGLVQLWRSKINMAWEKRNKRFGRDASDAMFFFKGPYDSMYTAQVGGLHSRYFGSTGEGAKDAGSASISPPTFRMTLNKVAELVQIFGPHLYYKNPFRQVTARQQVATTTDLLGAVMQGYPQYQGLLQMILQQSMMTNGADKSRSLIVESLLNATPEPFGLKTESRKAVDESLIKGMGLCWTQKFNPPAAGYWQVGSFFDTCDNLLIDPDATNWRNAKWIARRWCQPVWEVERQFMIEPGTLRPDVESINRQAEVQAMGMDGTTARNRGQTCDMIVWYEIFSKTGMGGRLLGAADGFTKDAADQLGGDYCYLAICHTLDYPLNCPPKLLDQPGSPQVLDQVKQCFTWSAPYYANDGGWPCSVLAFHEDPNDPWPYSHISFAMGELKFLNWGYSWLAGKIRTTCRDFIAVKAALSEEFKQVILSGEDLSLLPIAQQYSTVDEVVQFLQHPNMNTDIFTILQMVEQKFEERTGLSEVMYGTSARQYRSAAEAEMKQQQANIRPDDMANKVEDWQSNIARNEALGSRWHLKSADVQPFLGAPGAALWRLLIESVDPSAVLYDLQYRVEAGSIRKPNRQRDAENANALLQNVLPIAMQIAQLTGNTQPVNQILTTWAKTMDMDPALVQMPMLMLPPPGPGQGQGQGSPPAKKAA